MLTRDVLNKFFDTIRRKAPGAALWRLISEALGERYPNDEKWSPRGLILPDWKECRTIAPESGLSGLQNLTAGVRRSLQALAPVPSTSWSGSTEPHFRGSCKITVQDRSLAHQRASRGRGSVSAALSVSAFRAARASKRLHRILQLPLQTAKVRNVSKVGSHKSTCGPQLHQRWLQRVQ
jgi:hypothetical protein